MRNNDFNIFLMNILYKMVILKMWYIIIVGKSDKVRVLIEYIVYIDINCKVLFIFLLMGIWVLCDFYFWVLRFGIVVGM